MLKLICGRSRAGKTTYSKQFENVLHLDSFGMLPNNYPKLIDKVRNRDGDVVVDGIFDTVSLREELLEAYSGGGKKICIWIDTPLDVIESRFFYRCKPRNLPHPFDPPTLDEGWDKIIRIRNNGEHKDT